ncbi:MAG: HDOD domain-containing protein [Proteobacteria bacterium]|nr:HDOD domain-containing protein [Desulfobacula sp.]MBU3950654.1 HDOD domain-containing protein [Pseudomonadota bacterium]MBU4132493.1 HDOD domain-containing protein [Pseudomonadota bacterium]
MFSFFSKKTDPKAKLKKILKGYELPSFPAVVMEILQKIRSPYSSISSIAESLSLDPGISVKVLGIANSAAFSPSKRVENLTQAIALVGISQLESLVLGVGVAKGIPKKSCQWHDPASFWLTSAKRAMLASDLAHILCPAKESECFTAAFLQDMALPFLACQRSEEYDPIFKAWHLEGGDLAALERERLDWDHAQVAAWICSEWGLPENIAAAIRGHHGQSVPDHESLGPVRIVAILREDPDNSGIEEMIAEAQKTYGIPEEKMLDIIAPGFEKAKELARLII